MDQSYVHHAVPRPHKGQALLIALGLVLALGMLVAATQFLTIVHLSSSKVARYNERALLMAEQGVNQYLYSMSQGGGSPPVANAVTVADFATGVTNHTYTVTPYPANSKTEGYYACIASAFTGTGGVMYVYGWSHGVVRRVRVNVAPYSTFSWAGVYAIDPSLTGGATNYLGQWDTSTQNPAYSSTGYASIVGIIGCEGRMDNIANMSFSLGPARMAGPNARFGNASPPSTGTAPIPTADPSVASPFVRFYPSSLGLPTADQAAVAWIQSSQGVTNPVPAGVTYFQTANNNTTGLRYLVWDGSTSTSIRELGPLLNAQGQVVANYTVPVTTNGATALTNASWTAPGTLATTSDIKTGEQIYGIRVYPGDYYFDYVNYSLPLFLRSYNDTEYKTLASKLTYKFTYYANPNTRTVNGANTQLSGESNVRFWVRGSQAISVAPPTMEYAAYASRYKIYDADAAGAGATVSGGTSSSPCQLNLLCYNNDANGNGHGKITVPANTYVLGSLVGWQIGMTGGPTIQQQTPELGPGDRTIYVATSWSELL